MSLKDHLVRKFHESKQAPLWKWAVVIFMIVALPLFYTIIEMGQIEQVEIVEQQNQ